MASQRIRIDPEDPDRDAVARALHAAGPVVEVDLGGVNALAITHHEPLRTVLADRDGTFVRGDATRNWRALREGEVDPRSPLARLVGGAIGSLLTTHGDEHARLRRPLQTHFTRRRVETLRPRVEEIADRLLSDLDGTDAVDVKDRLAWPLTVGVLVELLGIGPEDAPILGDLARRLFELTDTSVFPDAWAFLRDLVAERRENLGDDLVSALVVTDDQASPTDRLGDDQIVANVFLLVMAGFETTMGTLTNGVRALLDHPDQSARVTGGEVEWSTAVEEILRRHSSVSLLPAAFSTRRTELAGVTVPEGEMLLLGFAASNVDTEAWSDPDTFDVGRDARGHLAFGHGPHLCLGAPLARLELGVALRALFERFPSLALDPRREDTAPVESWMMHHPKELWVLPHGAPE